MEERKLRQAISRLNQDHLLDLVTALFALMYAAQELGLEDDLNQYQSQSTGAGAFDFGYCVLSLVKAAGADPIDVDVN